MINLNIKSFEGSYHLNDEEKLCMLALCVDLCLINHVFGCLHLSGVVSHNGLLYVVGGRDSGSALSSV